MFGFKLWSKFGAFRDPMTITQNLTFPIPPKTTIGGILASILGIDYNDYFYDERYFNFKYSLVLLNAVQKVSYAQNYIGDYTSKSEKKHNVMLKYKKTELSLTNLLLEKESLEQLEEMTDSEKNKCKKINDKIEKEKKDLKKRKDNLINLQKQQFPKPKPIFRELLLNPQYLIFINNYKYEEEITRSIKNHNTKFAIYMGNTEFAANYEFIDTQVVQKSIDFLDSFTTHEKLLKFEPGKKYTSMHAATKSHGNREYKDYKTLIVCDKKISLVGKIDGYQISCKYGDFNCDFI